MTDQELSSWWPELGTVAAEVRAALQGAIFTSPGQVHTEEEVHGVMQVGTGQVAGCPLAVVCDNTKV